MNLSIHISITMKYYINIDIALKILAMKYQYCKNISFNLEILAIELWDISCQYCTNTGQT